jgi:hypothetical protein
LEQIGVQRHESLARNSRIVSVGKISHAKIRLATAEKFRVCAEANKGWRNWLTGSIPGLYCAPFQPKRGFRDFPAIDGVRNRVILGSSPRTFVVAGYYLKIRIGNLCGDSRHLPLVQLMMMSSKTTSCSFVRQKHGMNGCEFWISIASVT